MLGTMPENAPLNDSAKQEITLTSTLVACIDRTALQKRLILFRLYGQGDEMNSQVAFPIEGNSYGLKQFETEFVLVLGDNKVSIFNVAKQRHVRNVEFQGMFQRAILVHSERTSLFDEQQLIHATFIGYKYGTFSKLGVVCEGGRATRASAIS